MRLIWNSSESFLLTFELDFRVFVCITFILASSIFSLCFSHMLCRLSETNSFPTKFYYIGNYLLFILKKVLQLSFTQKWRGLNSCLYPVSSSLQPGCYIKQSLSHYGDCIKPGCLPDWEAASGKWIAKKTLFKEKIISPQESNGSEKLLGLAALLLPQFVPGCASFDLPPLSWRVQIEASLPLPQHLMHMARHGFSFTKDSAASI